VSADRRLAGRVALVTGGGRGIGRASALALAAEGARVVIADTGASREGEGVDAAVAEAAAEAVRAAGGEAVAACVDVSTGEGAEEAVARASEAFGGLDALVACAGVMRDRTFLKATPEDLDAVWRVGARGLFIVAQAAARRMVAQRRGGRIVTVTSTAGLYGVLGQGAGAATAAAVYGLTRVMAIELKKHAIRVNAIAPVARTRMTDDLPMFAGGGLTEETYGPAFVAPAVVFLASGASGEMSGEVVSVAGTKVSRYRVQESVGAVADDPRRPWTVDELAARWAAFSRWA
jgi:NAD(P)-dependent dehydrogenase (short-subunit alcohol dehydrogenase family)